MSENIKLHVRLERKNFDLLIKFKEIKILLCSNQALNCSCIFILRIPKIQRIQFLKGFFLNIYTRDSLQREARASECSLQRAREGTPPYPTCSYARHMMRAVSDVM